MIENIAIIAFLGLLIVIPRQRLLSLMRVIPARTCVREPKKTGSVYSISTVRRYFGLVMLLLAAPQVLTAQNRLPETEFTGFGDVVMSSDEADQDDRYRVNQAEIGVSAELHPKINAEAAIAWGGESFELGVLFVDFKLLGETQKKPGLLRAITAAGVMTGKFDVPFGIDWHVYPSIDRRLISSPLVIDNTHDAWNDDGIQLYLESPALNIRTFVVNGFGHQDEGPEGEPLEFDSKIAVGGRLGVTPVEWIELGGSIAELTSNEDDRSTTLTGLDAQVNYRNLSLKSEYLRHSNDRPGNKTDTNEGYYAQALYDFGQLYCVARYGSFNPDSSESNGISRFSGGLGVKLCESCQIRGEYQVNSDEARDIGLLQVAIGF